MTDFTPNPVLQASIEAKVLAAQAGSAVDPSTMTFEEFTAFVTKQSKDFTPEECRYMAEQTVYRAVQVELGKRIINTLNQHMKMDRVEIVPCIEAYFAAVDAGEVEAA